MNKTMNTTLGSALLITLLALTGCGKNAGRRRHRRRRRSGHAKGQ